MALVCALGLLLAVFRQIERWLHQHIFKVGWLLTNNFQTTTILYYILFLPGILLHELTVWIVARLLKLPAERAIGFPERQDIGELRLNFIRVSPKDGRLRYGLLRLAPLLAGVVCLWAIAAHIFRLQEADLLSPAGSIDELARAVARLTRTADFWLWFYLAFAIANTMYPSQHSQMTTRRKSVLYLALTAALFFAWRIGGALEPAATHGIEIVTGGLVLIVIHVILGDVLVVLGLGALEALIERLTGRSAAFSDGNMITMSRQEAHEYKREQARKRLAARKQQPVSKRVEIIRSVYDLKLPIPGPPGREPVSRNIVSVVTAPESPINASPLAETISDAPISPPRSTVTLEQEPVPAEPLKGAAAESAATTNQDPSSPVRPPDNAIGSQLDGLVDDLAPFSRPFANTSSGHQADDDMNDNSDEHASGELFPRPFTMKSRSQNEANAVRIPTASSDRAAAGDSSGEERHRRRRERARRTRPAPKPSERAARDQGASTLPSDNELSYEPLDDEDVYADDADSDYESLPSS